MITADLVRELFDYDPDTGVLTHKIARRGVVAGRRAGTLHARTGHRYVCVEGRKRAEHRVIWLWLYGVLPPDGIEIDHINNRRDDNRSVNLRLATREQNAQNTRKHKRSSTGLKGVNLYRNGRYRASIQAAGRQIALGYFNTAEEAHAAYCEASRRLHGEFHNPGT